MVVDYGWEKRLFVPLAALSIAVIYLLVRRGQLGHRRITLRALLVVIALVGLLSWSFVQPPQLEILASRTQGGVEELLREGAVTRGDLLPAAAWEAFESGLQREPTATHDLAQSGLSVRDGAIVYDYVWKPRRLGMPAGQDLLDLVVHFHPWYLSGLDLAHRLESASEDERPALETRWRQLVDHRFLPAGLAVVLEGLRAD
jgi:hypothetical protein